MAAIATYFLGDIRFPAECKENVKLVLQKHGLYPTIKAGRPGECVIPNADDPFWSPGSTPKDVLHKEGLLDVIGVEKP